MSNSPYIVDVDMASFEAIVIENSFRAPVLVNFYSNTNQECLTLMPELVSIIEFHHGQLLLAKVDADIEYELVQQYGIGILPTVKLFRNGEVVEEFTGPQPESVIRQLLDPYLSRPSDEVAMQAVAAYDAGDKEQALTLLASVYTSDPENHRALLLYGKLLAEQGQIALAQEVIRQLPETQQDNPDIRALLAHLEFGAATAPEQDIEQLEASLLEKPDDHEVRYQLANLYIANGHYEPGMELLIILIQTDADFKDGIARQTLFKVFDMLGGSGPLVSRYRSRLYTLLH